MNEKEQLERTKIVAEALTWQKTLYHPNGRIKGAGTDCGLFILEVFERCGLLPHIEIPYYPVDIACHCADPMYLMKIQEYTHKVEREPLPGDILVFKFPGSKVPHHAAICIDDEFIIHALIDQGVLLSNRRGYKKFEIGTYCFDGWTS